jgi:MoxR-like ATPase
MTETLRQPAEKTYATEISALIQADDGPRPAGWQMTPRSVVTYLMGGTLPGGAVVTPKYVGSRKLMENAVATIATDRGLLLLGVPGTAKSWVSEHLSAAVSGDSTLVIQGTAGTDENQVRYGWNYAQLLAHGPSREALVATPLMRSMEQGRICRIEELTRMGSDVQDTLITILSEKMMPIPELNDSVYAARGFNVIATANNRDKGVNELSSALQRRFNVVILPLPGTADEEVSIIVKRVGEMSRQLDLAAPRNVVDEVKRVVSIFRELRSGQSQDGRVTLKTPSGSLSAAEAIGVMVAGVSEATYFGNGQLTAETLASSMVGAIVKDPTQDKAVLGEYLETVLKRRSGFGDYYASLSGLI